MKHYVAGLLFEAETTGRILLTRQHGVYQPIRGDVVGSDSLEKSLARAVAQATGLGDMRSRRRLFATVLEIGPDGPVSRTTFFSLELNVSEARYAFDWSSDNLLLQWPSPMPFHPSLYWLVPLAIDPNITGVTDVKVRQP